MEGRRVGGVWGERGRERRKREGKRPIVSGGVLNTQTAVESDSV